MDYAGSTKQGVVKSGVESNTVFFFAPFTQIRRRISCHAA
jgi:hypothetical protein